MVSIVEFGSIQFTQECDSDYNLDRIDDGAMQLVHYMPNVIAKDSREIRNAIANS
jgi:hypothetical protein